MGKASITSTLHKWQIGINPSTSVVGLGVVLLLRREDPARGNSLFQGLKDSVPEIADVVQVVASRKLQLVIAYRWLQLKFPIGSFRNCCGDVIEVLIH